MDKTESAFPVAAGGDIQHGMTLRDYFAAAALSSCSGGDFRDDESCANWCYKVADAMLTAREKGDE